MFRKSIVAKIWVTIVLLMVLIIASLGLGLFRLTENFYYSQTTKNLITQASQIANMYSDEPEAFQNSSELDRISRILNAHIMLLNEEGKITACNMSLHMLPGSVFEEAALVEIFNGKIIAQRGYHNQFEAQMLSVGVPVKSGEKISQALLIYTPVAPISATLNSLKGLVYWALLGALILASILAFLQSRSLSKPLVQMNQVALALAKGDYTQRIAVGSGDEIGVLGASLNYLTEQLRENIGKVQKLEEMRRELIANVSHELRTPISLISGYSEAIIDGVASSPEQIRDFIQVIHDEGNRLKYLVEDLLELSRLQSGAIKLEKEWVNIERVALEVKNKFHQVLIKDQTEFQLEISPGAELIWADGFRFEQIIINLVSNAVHYAPGGIIKIHSERNEQNMIVSISDTGQGISASDLPFVFERFYRADKSRNRESGGTGLGLAIVKNLVEAHQGTIQVESQEGAGTVFTLSFPN